MLKRVIAGLALVGTIVGVAAPLAGADVVPTAKDIQRLVKELKVEPPVVSVPTFDPANPQLPQLPYVQIPVALNPALGVLAPAGVTTCQAAYLGPLGGAVALTVVLDSLPDGTLPVQPSFLAPATSPLTTACVLAPFPRWTACTNDAAIAEQSEAVPAPFAALVTEVDALQKLASYYALNREPFGRDIAGNLGKRLGCK